MDDKKLKAKLAKTLVKLKASLEKDAEKFNEEAESTQDRLQEVIDLLVEPDEDIA